MRFPLSKPAAHGKELEYLETVLHSERWSGGGDFTQRCERFIAAQLDDAHTLLVPSGTAALEMAALAIGIREGDEVIMPSFTFSSCANAVALRGGVPVFVDARPDTLNLDESKIEAALTPRTRAIMPVHYGGIICEMDRITDLAKDAGICVIEDAAQAYLSTYRGQAAGTIGDAGAISFHETKNVGCGEGGAFTTTSPEIARSAEIIRDKGTNRSQFFRGEVDKYSWLEIGSSYVISEFQSAVLLAQLERARALTDKRLRLWDGYAARLAGLVNDGALTLATIPSGCEHNAHIFWIMLAPQISRARVTATLRESGIGATFHFVPLHSSQAGRRLGRTSGPLTVTDAAAERQLRLPLSADFSENDLDFITERVTTAIRSALA